MGILRPGVALLAAIAGGCYSPELRDCTLTCSAASDCADGQVCGDDHFCAAPGIAGRCSTLPTDAGGTIRDAAVDGPKIVDARPDAAPDATVWAAIEVTIEGQGRVIVQNIATCEKAGPQNGSCMFYVLTGSAVTVHAQGYFDWHFDKWTLAACEEVDGSTCTFQAIATSYVNAKFKRDD